MQTQPYTYDKKHLTRYTFVSKGRMGAITKMVEFSPTSIKNIFNLGFGDLLPAGTIDDKANSNNGDIMRIMATMIAIIEDFTNVHPGIKIVFTGSTLKRTNLYGRILKMYYSEFRKHFVITVLVDRGDENYTEDVFEPDSSRKYVAFFIKRK